MGSDMSVDASDASTPRLREYNGLTSSSLSLSGSDDDAVTVPYEDLPDDVFGMAICSLCRDIFFISRKEGSVTPRVARILASLLKVVFTVCMQVFLLIEIKHYVTPPTVYEVRKIYSMYEKQMYDKTEINYNNHFRGVSGFNASRFNDLRADEQESVCAIPLSRPFFFGVVLYLWTICNFVDLKITWGAAESLVFLTSSCRYMRDALALVDQNKHHRVFVISKLPIWMKAIIIVMVVLPRAVITLRVLLPWLSVVACHDPLWRAGAQCSRPRVCLVHEQDEFWSVCIQAEQNRPFKYKSVVLEKAPLQLEFVHRHNILWPCVLGLAGSLRWRSRVA